MTANIALRKTSLTDYPGRVSSVIFFPGCNLRCPWCHNRELVLGTAPLISLDEGLAHIRKRKPVLGGVVLSGGEPCLYSELGALIREIKKLSLPVKLDTNGMCPDMLERLFSDRETSPDYIALDLKIAPNRYVELLPGSTPSGENSFNPCEALIQSAALIRESGISHEYRSLALPSGFGPKDIEALAPLTGDAPWYFRPFHGGNCLDPSWDSLEENAEEASSRAEALAKEVREQKKN